MDEQITKEPTTEELTFAAHDKIDALIDLLIQKKLFTEKEYLETLSNLYSNEEDVEIK